MNDELMTAWSDVVDSVMREQGIASRADAAQIARSRYPQLAAAWDAEVAPRKSRMQMQRTSGAISSAQPQRSPGIGPEMVYTDPERELEARARKISAEEHVSYAQGYVHALNRDPRLYLDFLRAQQRKLDAQETARRG